MTDRDPPTFQFYKGKIPAAVPGLKLYTGTCSLLNNLKQEIILHSSRSSHQICVSSQAASWHKKKCSHTALMCHNLLGLWWWDRNWDHKLVLPEEHNTEKSRHNKRLHKISQILSIRDAMHMLYLLLDRQLGSVCTPDKHITSFLGNCGEWSLLSHSIFNIFNISFFFQVEDLICLYDCLLTSIGLLTLIWLLFYKTNLKSSLQYIKASVKPWVSIKKMKQQMKPVFQTRNTR